MSVYFVTCRELGRVKIGHASNAKRRFHQLQTHSPAQLQLDAVTDGGEAEELQLHARFAEHHIKGEWFSLCPEIEQMIASLAPQAAVIDDSNPVAELLTTFRISQHELADRLGVNQGTISRLRTGKTSVGRRTRMACEQVARTLNAEFSA